MRPRNPVNRRKVNIIIIKILYNSRGLYRDSITSGTPQKRETVKVYARFVPSKVIVFIFCFLLQMLSFTYKMTNSYTTRSCKNINYSNILYRIEAIYFIDVFYTLFISTLFYQVLNCVVKYYFSFY